MEVRPIIAGVCDTLKRLLYRARTQAPRGLAGIGGLQHR